MKDISCTRSWTPKEEHLIKSIKLVFSAIEIQYLLGIQAFLINKMLYAKIGTLHVPEKSIEAFNLEGSTHRRIFAVENLLNQFVAIKKYGSKHVTGF